MNVVRAGLVVVLLGELAWLYDQRSGLPDPLSPVLSTWKQAQPADLSAPTIVFVVLDTVRSDHTSLCGYGRPTTPNLTALRGRGASVSCRTYAPGAWTMPSHASYFTGVSVPEHGVHFVDPSDEQRRVFEGTGFYTRPLRADLPTLAEQLSGRGYQTLSVAANPLIGPETGLTRGFDVADVVNSNGHLVIRQVIRRLRWTVDPERPLFLFVNLGDAHEPWDPVPWGVDWLPARSGLGWGGAYSPFGLDDIVPWLYPRTDQFDRLVSGRMGEEERAAWLSHVTDVYDWGVYTADHAVGQLVDALEDHGWDKAGLRLVVTSDHGEHLGEHDLGDHGRFLSEAVTRVPLVVYDSAGSPELPDPVSGLVVHELVLDGALPAELPVPASFEFPDATWAKRFDGRGGQTRVSVWGGDLKLDWVDGQQTTWNVAVDPAETAPLEGDAGLEARMRAELRVMAGADRRGGEMTPEMVEALRGIGYVE